MTNMHPLEVRRKFGSHKLSVLNWLCLAGDALNEAADELQEGLLKLSPEERERGEAELAAVANAAHAVWRIDNDLTCLVLEHEERMRLQA